MMIQGDISIDATATPMFINMEYLLKDNETGNVYWINNYVLLLKEGTDFVKVEIEGSAGSRFYDHDFGYVNLSTTDPFIIYENDYYPTSGVLVCVLQTKYLLSNPLLCDTKNKKLQLVKDKNITKVKNPN